MEPFPPRGGPVQDAVLTRRCGLVSPNGAEKRETERDRERQRETERQAERET